MKKWRRKLSIKKKKGRSEENWNQKIKMIKKKKTRKEENKKNQITQGRRRKRKDRRRKRTKHKSKKMEGSVKDRKYMEIFPSIM